MSNTCGFCGHPIQEREGGIRYFGKFIAHNEAECRRILISEITTLRQQLAEMTARAEDAERRMGRLFNILKGIHNLLTAPDFEGADGVVYEFNNPEVEHRLLKELCKRIRKIPEEIQALEETK